ncbi:CHAT domain-containing protein [Streptomyces sp. NBC_00846]|uniref:CHAT domain-containing protein n=1 Tax=Streptomyces sp. NBC_00846 TaxID=2975849 RepID=UPI003867F19A|nr:CHAT domain-containing protein [Streptomyces sp. NBC_00846]
MNHPQLRVICAHHLAVSHWILHDRGGAPEHAEQAADAALDLLDACVAAKEPDPLMSAAELLTTAMNRLPAGHHSHKRLVLARGAALMWWMKVTGDPGPLEAADEDIRRAVHLCHPEDPFYREVLISLADLVGLRLTFSRQFEDLTAAIDGYRRVLDALPHDDQVAHDMLANLGICYRVRYETRQEQADIDEAVHYFRMAVERIRDPGKLAAAKAELAKAITLQGPEERMTVPPGGLTFLAGPGSRPKRPLAEAAHRPEELAAHAVLLADLLAEYERGGDNALLDRIDEHGHAVLDALPPTHAHRWVIGRPLGLALLRRFEATGRGEDLHEAVELLREVVGRPAGGMPEESSDLMHLSGVLIARFKHEGGVAGLDEAIALARRAEVSASDRSELARALNALGTALVYRAQFSGSGLDLREAISVGESALAAADTPSLLAHAQGTLGNRLRQRYLADGDPADLDAAIGLMRTALAHRDNKRAAVVRTALALALRDRGVLGGDGGGDLAEAATLYRAALADEAVGSPQYGHAQLALAEVLNDLGRREEAIGLLDDLTRSGSGSRLDRMDAARTRAGLLADRAFDADTRRDTADGGTGVGGHGAAGDWRAATDAFSDAVNQLHLSVWRGLSRADRARLLARWSGLASDAAAAAINLGDAERAVELLDHGRSLLWGQALDGRTDLTALRAVRPDLANELDTVHTGFAAEAWTDERGAHSAAEHRRRLALDWERLVTSVRTLPGFAGFLLPTPFAELSAAAAEGPVVLVNVSVYRCDALVVSAEGVRVVPLPRLTLEQAEAYARRHLRAMGRTGGPGLAHGPRDQALLSVCEWLWDTVAGPVLAETALLPQRRIWWCPTGALTQLPLHTAGYHDPEDSHRAAAVIDRAVSSLTPTLRALLHARRPAKKRPRRLLAVACEQRPRYVTGLADLPLALREVSTLRDLVPDATIRTGGAATRAEAMALLPGHTCAHFACHGGPGGHGPEGRSVLFLADERLTMADFAGLDLADAELAVLSACHTATAGPELPDEADHLAGALQIAGFRQVVSTLWAIGDDTAAAVTDDLYRALTADGGDLDPGHAATALHTVLLRLREAEPYRPAQWAPFVHFGC